MSSDAVRGKGLTRRLALLAMPCLMLAGLSRDRPAKAQQTEVDVILLLAVDCSYSVDTSEFVLQMQGIANAFRQPEIQKAITDGLLGRIAVGLMQWSSDRFQVMAVPWTLVDSPASANAFADIVAATPRRLAEGGTAIGSAMEFAEAALKTAPAVSNRLVVDISADGRNNKGPRPFEVRPRLTDQNITINGLAILNEFPRLERYFERYIVGGPFHFVITANDYDAYAEAIYRKLLKEITGPGIS